MVQSAAQSSLSKLDADLLVGLERIQGFFHTLASKLDIMHRMTADSLDLCYFPSLPVSTSQKTNVRRLAAAFGKQHSVMEKNLQ